MKRPTQPEQAANALKPGSGKNPAVALRLYVAGLTPNSQRAKANLETALTRMQVVQDVRVEVVDVLVDARRAIADNVIVTPTLLGLGTMKPQVMIGDLSNSELLESFVASLAGTARN